MKVRNFERFSLKLTAPLQSIIEREKANMGTTDPRALRTSEAPEDATQGVYRLSHAI